MLRSESRERLARITRRAGGHSPPFKEKKMARFVSKKNPISTAAIKRKAAGSVVIRHGGREDVRFTRVEGGYKRERMDVTERTTVVSSSDVAKECNTAMGCKSSWAKVY